MNSGMIVAGYCFFQAGAEPRSRLSGIFSAENCQKLIAAIAESICSGKRRIIKHYREIPDHGIAGQVSGHVIDQF